MTTGNARQSELVTTLRKQIDAGKSVQAQGAALSGHIARLASNTVAGEAHADPRTTPELLAGVTKGDHSAELPLYVRVATDLERTAARIAGDSALSREDLHQEGAVRLLEDARSGLIGERFGGNVGPYIGRAVSRHLVDLVDSQRPGRPKVPGRERRKLREALNATAHEGGTYNTIAAVQYARSHFGWSLAAFWAVHGSAFGTPVQWDDAATTAGLTYADMTADPTATDELDRVEDREDVRRLLERANLTDREREVIDAVCGFTGSASTNEEAAELLGVSVRHVRRLRSSALEKLGMAADEIGITHEGLADDECPEIVAPRTPYFDPCRAA
ncbi:RNA polymerase sigma factor [Amycolatopsis sp. NPDC059657]|uniref:RNA polymerase sigma factor n=1 Tax=Amycolatopsis sp. NPDC059657 TaxID=3346899 RepID=UPI00366BDA43